METTYLLVRHGATSHLGHIVSGRAAGIHLNEEGRQQAAGLARRLRHIPIEAIYCSPLERAMETAQPLAASLGLEIHGNGMFTEIDFGEWTNLRLDQLKAVPLWHPFNSFRSGTRAPGGELISEVQARAVAELDRLRHVHAGHTVAIFSHADVIKYALAYYAGIPLDLASRIEIYPASVSVLAIGEYSPRLISLNDTGRPLLS
jgi:probable phosphomutase (TIGR03848 family)